VTGKEFKAALKQLEMTQRAFCDETGVSEPTVNRWVGAKKDVPPLAEAYIRLLLSIHRARSSK